MHEDSDEPLANVFVLSSGALAIRVEPREELVESFLV
jgi:hypothetical protein